MKKLHKVNKLKIEAIPMDFQQRKKMVMFKYNDVIQLKRM